MMKNIKQVYYVEYKVSSINCFEFNSNVSNYCYHNNLGPAKIEYCFNDLTKNNIISKEYMIEGLYSNDKLSSSEYDSDGIIRLSKFYKKGLCHHDLGPAICFFDVSGNAYKFQYWYNGIYLHKMRKKDATPLGWHMNCATTEII